MTPQIKRNSYAMHMREYANQPIRIFDCITFFYNGLDVEENRDFINTQVQSITAALADQYGMAMNNGCMPLRILIMPLNPIMRTVTFADTHVKLWKKAK
jgi:hypothetical protein